MSTTDIILIWVIRAFSHPHIQGYINRQTAKTVTAIVSVLGETQHAALALKYYKGYTTGMIAKCLGISKRRARIAIRRGCVQLRTYIETVLAASPMVYENIEELALQHYCTTTSFYPPEEYPQFDIRLGDQLLCAHKVPADENLVLVYLDKKLIVRRYPDISDGIVDSVIVQLRRDL